MQHVFLILPSRSLIIESFASEIDLPDYIAFKTEQISHPDFDSGFDVLSDLRWAEFAFPPREVHKLVEFFKENVDLEAHRKGCLLTFEPMQTAYSMLFKKHTEGKGVSWKVCTTLMESLAWLNDPLTIEELEVTLAELKEQRERKI
ncbi:hypothetical protein [Owenweeksia hongkongensis]|uniref:hypothetical protein n=1 Tax=Owenweeksia hongkongensis TaxID=253245 RepID=UPI003A9551EA